MTRIDHKAMAKLAAYRDGQIAGLHEMIKDLKAERDAAFVDGLKRAKVIIGDKSVWATVIQAEIDNASTAVNSD